MTNPVELVFIVAPTGKCGTNFMINVLTHLGLARLPDTDALRREDHLLGDATLLCEYVRNTIGRWLKWTEYSTAQRDEAALLRAIGEGLVRFIGVGGLPPIAVKTPSAENIHLGPLLFPEAAFILMVRDGRDATESGLLSNYWTSYEEAFAEWADGVATLQRFIQAEGQSPRRARWVLVRYESLVLEPEETLRSITCALGCPNVKMDVSALTSLPVFGSIDYGRGEDGSFAWRIAAKDKRFNPVGRWRLWGESTRELFKNLAGDELISLGYEKDDSW